MSWIRLKNYALLASFAFVLACTTEDCGCDGFEQRPFPVDAYENTIPGGGQVRVTQAGLRFVEDSVPFILEQFLPEGLSFCIPEDTSGNPSICVDSTCRGGAPGCQVDLALDDSRLTPVPPRTILTGVTIGDVDERLNFDYSTFLGTVRCEVKLFKAGHDDDTSATISADIPVTLDTDRTSALRELKVNVGDIELDLSDVDFKIRGRNNFGDTVACGGASLVRGFFRGMIEDQIMDMLDQTTDGMTDAYLCRTCGTGLDPCPSGSSCASGICRLNGSTECVPAPLGIEGRLNIGNILGDFALATNANMSVLLKAADHAAVDTGISVGMRSGFEPGSLSRCVPTDSVPRPGFGAIPLSPELNADTKPNSSQTFMIGIGVHRRVLEHALWSAWGSGATCLAVSTDDVEVINTGAFGALLPSLREITNGRTDALFHIVPQGPPVLVLGANTIQPSGGSYEIRDPLITLDWRDLDLHIFGYALDRMVRLFTLRLDINIPIALIPDGQGNLIVVMEDLNDAIQNVRPHKAELLAEDPQRLIDILPTLLNIALPAVGDSVPDSFALPEFLGFRLALEQGDITTIDGGDFIAIFANFARGGSSLRAELQPVVVDKRVSLDERTPSGLVRPTVELDLFSFHQGFLVANDEGVEYSYRVGGTLWSHFHRTTRLSITHPLFLLQGHHTIEIRARHVDNPETTSSISTTVGVLLDWEAPELDLKERGSELLFLGFDAGDPNLEYRHRLKLQDDDWRQWSAWSTRDRVDLSGLSGEIEVEARDDAGHTTLTSRSFAMNTAPAMPEVTDGTTAGCTAAPGQSPSAPWWIVALALGLYVRRRYQGPPPLAKRRGGAERSEAEGTDRHKILILALIALLALFSTGCGGCKGELAIEKDQGCVTDSDCSDFCDFGGSGFCKEDQCACARFCPDGCENNEYCCFQSDSCEPIGDVCGEQSCEPGYEFRVSRVNPDREACVVEDFDCACAPLPPIPLGQFGPYSDIATNDDVIVVSTYSRTYRDLMVGVVADNDTIAWYFVDGLPDEAPIVGDPNGYRGGMIERGGRVGLYTSIAVDSQGVLHVLYRDVEATALKYARGTIGADGRYEFEATTLDAEADAGYWTSVIAVGDTIHGVYTARTAESAWTSELRHFSFPSSTAVPQITMNPTVIDTGDVCTPRCENMNFPNATGLFARLTPSPDGLLLTYYDASRNRASRTFFEAGAWEDPTRLAVRTGPYTAGVMDSAGTLHVAFMNHSSLRHIHFSNDGTQAGAIHEGIRDNPEGYYAGPIGDNVALAIDGSNRVVASFQDAYDHALYFAVYDGEDWSSQRLRPETDKYTGAHGFYSSMVIHQGVPVIVEYLINNQANPPTAAAVVHRVP
ncbi:MAG: MYXO-CTERM sorting domain-containing protein [Bradymonadaceae bacterium]